MHDILPPNAMCSESHDRFKFLEISDTSRKRCKIDIVAMED